MDFGLGEGGGGGGGGGEQTSAHAKMCLGKKFWEAKKCLFQIMFRLYLQGWATWESFVCH